jgi:hypothetical protein
MGSKNKTTSAERLSIGFGILAIAGIFFFLADRPRAGVFTLLTLFIPYLLVLAPFHCRELTTRNTACINARWGWLFGCHHHRWFALRRLFGAPLPPRSSIRSGPAVTTVMSSGPVGSNSRWYDGVTLVAGVVSAIAGVWALF